MESQKQSIEEPTNVIPLQTREVHTQTRRGEYNAVQRVTRALVREARRERLSYDQLRRVFANCRDVLDLKLPKERTKLKTLRIPTTEELRRFLGIQPPEHRLIFSFMLGTGLRVFEVCQARVGDLDLQQNTLFVRDGKGGKSRVVTYSNRLKRELEIWIAGKDQTYIFESARNTKWSKRAIQSFAERYSKESGVKINCHLLRHTFCSRLASGTANAPGLSEAARATLMGHSKSSTSVLQARYTSVALEGIKPQAIAVLDDFEN